MKTIIRSVYLLLFTLCFSGTAAAQNIPLAISYQAVLNDDSGDPISPDAPTNFPVAFRIYDSVLGGTLLWSESQNVSVFMGSFSTLLGTGDEITDEPRPQLDTVFNNAQRFLEVTITEGATSKTFAPRQQMVSTPFSFRAKVADEALSVADNVIAGRNIIGLSVSELKLANDSVTASKIKADSITSAKIAPGEVQSTDLAASAVNISKLADEVAKRLVPAGTVNAWAGAVTVGQTMATGEVLSGVPDGWLLCNGQEVSTGDYPELFKAVAYLYGGSGATFNLPDYRGYFLRGETDDPGLGEDPDRSGRTLASGWAEANGPLLSGSSQGDIFGSHTHPWKYNEGGTGTSDRNGTWDTVNNFQGEYTRFTESRGGSETRPKNKYVWYIIKAH